MDYVELNVRVTDPELAEILTAELAELPYESFQTEGEVLKAYIPRERLADCMQQTDDLLARYGIADRRYIAIESQNWNALWEQNFTPVDVDGRILIRARSTHRNPDTNWKWSSCPAWLSARDTTQRPAWSRRRSAIFR